MTTLTEKEAIRMCNSKWWEGKTAKEIVDFQLYERRLATEFSIYHKAIEEVLKRPVFTHEFADPVTLQEEYEGKQKYDGLIPSIKRIVEDTPVIIVMHD